MNKTGIAGILLGMAAVLGGNIIEGGRIGSVVQGSAALIVFGGTFGATILSFSAKDIKLAVQMLREVFFENRLLPENAALIKEIVSYSVKARKSGLLSLEDEIKGIQYDFLRRALSLVIDGIDSRVLRDTLEQENRTFEEKVERAAKVFEAAGGFAPTVGIIGAVLGLIHVMENLSDPTKLGAGIAVAFVATIYGVASANLIFLPIAKRLTNNIRHEMLVREMIIDGMLGIQAGSHPFFLEEHLNSYLPGRR